MNPGPRPGNPWHADWKPLAEIPITQALLGAKMGKGLAVALLLAGPALSLPSVLVLRGFLGMQKALVYGGLVVVMATISGMIFGTSIGVKGASPWTTSSFSDPVAPSA